MSSAAVKRLQTEARDFARDAPPLIEARPSEDNLFVWLFVLNGAPGTPYEQGEYVGRLTFPEDYPFRPPKIEMLTPSGRFITNMRLCLSISDYHPESWSPAWTVSTILVGVLSFMSESAQTAGSMLSSDDDKRRLAKLSHGFNLSLPEFAAHFPDRTGEQVASPMRCAGHAMAGVSPATVSQAMSPTNDAVADALAEYAMDDEYYLDYTDVGGDEAEDEEDDETESS